LGVRSLISLKREAGYALGSNCGQFIGVMRKTAVFQAADLSG